MYIVPCEESSHYIRTIINTAATVVQQTSSPNPLQLNIGPEPEEGGLELGLGGGGAVVGRRVGAVIGRRVGGGVGRSVGATGDSLGTCEDVGIAVGDFVGATGAGDIVGEAVGKLVGAHVPTAHGTKKIVFCDDPKSPEPLAKT